MISDEKLSSIAEDHSNLKKKFNIFKKKFLLNDKSIPLDYIMTLPKHLKGKDKEDDDRKVHAYRLENQFKNVAIRRLEQIRTTKAKKTVKDSVSDYLKKLEEKNQRGRIRIKEQVLQIYEEKAMTQFDEKDPMFNKIIVHIQRVIKIMKAQT
jgi:hypothetical protein